MLKNLILFFFVFGCWTKYLEWPVGYISYNIWYVIIASWVLLNALGLLTYCFKKNPKKKKATMSQDVKDRWIFYNILATVSFWFCGELGVTVAFLFTSVAFMLFFLIDNKKK